MLLQVPLTHTGSQTEEKVNVQMQVEGWSMCIDVKVYSLGVLQSSPSKLSSQSHVSMLLQVPLTHTGSQTEEESQCKNAS